MANNKIIRGGYSARVKSAEGNTAQTSQSQNKLPKVPKSGTGKSRKKSA